MKENTSDLLASLNALCQDTFISFLGIRFVDCGDDFLEARMPVRDKLQPMGLLHGGASLALAETTASGGSYLLVDREKYDVLGFQVSGNHLATVTEGFLLARAQIVHKGNTTHVWDVRIWSDKGKLIAVSRVTNMIIKKNS